MINLIREQRIQEVMSKHQLKIQEYITKITEKEQKNRDLEMENKALLVQTEQLKKDNATLGTLFAVLAKKSFDNNLIKLQRQYIDNEDIMKQNIIDIEDLKTSYQDYMDRVVNKEINEIKCISSIKELGYSLLTIMKDCLEKKIPFCLDDSDKHKIITPSKYQDINYFEEVVFTYKTNDPVKYNQINPNNQKIALGINHENKNDTNNRYGVLIFVNRDLLENAIGVAKDDIYFDKKIQIRSGYLLCPASEYQEILSLNEDLFVIPYNDISVDGYIDVLLYELGYQIIEGDVLNKIRFNKLISRGIEKKR